MNYKKAKFFEEVNKGIEEVYLSKDWSNLCTFNIRLLKSVLNIINLEKKLIKASELDIKGESTHLLINIIKKVGGDTYLSGFGGTNYQEESLFSKEGIRLQYTDFQHPVYPQLWGDFMPNLSIIDLLFNCGPDSRKFLLGEK